MLKNKLLLLLTYSIILNYFGDALHSLPQFFAPILYFGIGNLFYQLQAVLLLLSFIYLGLSSVIYPYQEDKKWFIAVQIFLALTLFVPIINFFELPEPAQWKFGISLLVYLIANFYIIKKLKKAD